MSVPPLSCSLRSKCRSLPALQQATMPPKKMAPVVENFVVFAWMTKDQIERKWIDEGRDLTNLTAFLEACPKRHS